MTLDDRAPLWCWALYFLIWAGVAVLAVGSLFLGGTWMRAAYVGLAVWSAIRAARLEPPWRW